MVGWRVGEGFLGCGIVAEPTSQESVGWEIHTERLAQHPQHD